VIAAHRSGRSGESLWELLGLGSPEETAWMAGAVCAQTDPEAFFPAKGERLRPARMVCAACPVRLDCLAYALARPGLEGIWAGTTRNERQAMRRQSAGESAELWRGAA
jgi:WhiB family redox-sensing transcriptional regulator